MSSGRGAQRSDLEDTATTRANAEMPAQPFQQAADVIRDRQVSDDDDLRTRNRFENEELDDDAFPGLGTFGLASEGAGERTRALAIIKHARKATKASRPVSAKTQQDYESKANRLRSVVAELEGDMKERWTKAMTRYAPKSRSFFANRAAVTSHCRSKVRLLLSEQCKLQRKDGMTGQWFDVVQRLNAELELLGTVERIDRTAVLESINAKSVPGSSKRTDLNRLPADWRRQLIAHSQTSEAYGVVVCALAATGCRPEELTRGIRVQLEYSHATFAIRGAKFTSESGQEWRELDVDWKSLPKHLLEPLQNDESILVGIWSTAGLRDALARFGRALWPRGPRISAYTFRHAAAEDMRESGWRPDEIGAALGHRVGETCSQYGRRRRPGQRGGGVTPTAIIRGGVRTTVPVRKSLAFDATRPPWKGGSASKATKTRPR